MSHDVARTVPAAPSALRWLAGLVALAAVALVAGLIVLLQQSGDARDAALVRARHSYDILMLTGEIDGSLARSEAALGRFVMDGDRPTGTLYYDEWRHAGLAIARLRPLLADDPRQIARLDRLRGYYDRRGRELAGPAARATYRQGWQAVGLIAKAARSDTLPGIARELRAIGATEQARLDTRSAAYAAQTDHANGLVRTLSLVGALLAASVLALGWAVMSVLAERRVARDDADQESNRSAQLEHAVAARTAELRHANEQLIEAAAIREQAEMRLRQVQKMDAVGQLTGGIAHDFNNMLAVVLGGLELARARVTAQAEEATRHIDSAMEGATRAAALTRRLLSFARAEPLLPSAADPPRLLTGLSSLIDRTIGERIAVRIEAAAGTWPVWVDPYQLENAILNLAVNARDAMAGEGRIVMRANNVRLATHEVGALDAGDYVRIAVTDDGGGMSPATLERVFEPFFTTKPTGQGTGLGLSQILGFARQSGGDVAIASREGHGTTVSIYLPRHHGAVEEEAASFGPLPRAAADAPRLLVVEDDPRVRAATAAALAELGYRALLCDAGEEALTLLQGNPDVALVITDVVMPGMTGPQLADAIGRRRPALPILFVTGYVGEAGEADQFAGHAVLRKPFTLRRLADAVAGAMLPPARIAAE